MSKENRNVEVLVGLFLLIGFSFIAVMVVVFGRVGQSMSKYYPITVIFPNASGLVKDSDVLLSGARIGFVAQAPTLTNNATYAVQVTLNIREDVKIPRKSTILVGSSGLMGDRYVDVIPQSGFDAKDVSSPNDVIIGTRASGIDDLTASGDAVMKQLGTTVEEIHTLTLNLNQRLLNDQNLRNIEEAIAGIKTVSANFSESSAKLAPLLSSAQEVVASAKSTMKTADAAAGELKAAIGDVRKTAESVGKTVGAAKELIDSGKGLIKKAGEGSGPLGTLIADKDAAGNLKAFLANLRRSGPLFYKDRAPVLEEAPVVKPGPRR